MLFTDSRKLIPDEPNLSACMPQLTRQITMIQVGGMFSYIRTTWIFCLNRMPSLANVPTSFLGVGGGKGERRGSRRDRQDRVAP